MSLPIDFEAIPEREKSNTLFLRGLRAALEQEVFSDLTWYMDEERAKKHLDQLIAFTSPEAGFHTMKESFISHERYVCITQLKLLRDVCYRIARLEREACGIPLEPNLKAA